MSDLEDIKFITFGSIVNYTRLAHCTILQCSLEKRSAFYTEYCAEDSTSHCTNGVTFSVQRSYAAAMLPFLTDQIIGARSEDVLVTVLRWLSLGCNMLVPLVFGALELIARFSTSGNFLNICVYAIPLAVIIISDCLCQQWLHRTHKVINPIIAHHTGTQVQYRRHSYPEKRSAFTYIDEEQPARMDYGKEKFGGPFTECGGRGCQDCPTLAPILGT